LFSSVLGAVPVSGADGIGVLEVFDLPVATEDILVAPLADGSLLVAVVTAGGTQFLLLPAAEAGPVQTLASFPFVARAEPSPLSVARLSASTTGHVAVVFEADGAVRVAALDAAQGSQAFEVTISDAAEIALHPTVAVHAGEVLAAYYGVSTTGGRVCLVALAFDTGDENSRSCVAARGAPFPALLRDGASTYLTTTGPQRTSIYAVDGGALVRVGDAPVGGHAAALWVRAGQLQGVVSSGALTHLVTAPLDDLSSVTRTALPVPSPTVSVAAAVANDGRLAAAGSTASGSWVLGEGGITHYTVAWRESVLAASAVTDAYGLARVLLAQGPLMAPTVGTFSVGDASAVQTSIEGPASVLPTDWALLHVTLKAVRTPVTVVGLGVSVPEGWSAQSPSITEALAAGETASSDIRVQPPPGAPPGDYEIRVTPAVLESSIPHTSTYTLQVAPAPSSVSAVYSGSALALEPGESTVVGVQVTNRGGAAAVTEVRSGPAAAGLTVSPPSSTVTVPSGATETVWFVVSAAASALPADGTRLGFEVVPPDGSVPTRLEVVVSVIPVFLPALVVGLADLSAAPGGGMPLSVRVVNGGNAEGLVTVTADTLGLPPWALTQPGHPLQVPAFGSVDAGLVLSVPVNAVADQRYSVSVEAADAAGAALAGTRTLFGTVLPVVGISATYEAGAAIIPDGASSGTLTVSNLGNRPVTFSLGFGTGASGFTVFPDGMPSGGLVIDAWSSLDVPLTLRAPRDAAPGPLELTVTISSDAGAPLVVPLPVDVAEVHAFGMRALTPQLTVRDPAVERVVVEVALSSGSNTPELVALDFGGVSPPLLLVLPDGTARPLDEGAPVLVPPFETATVRALVPVGLAPGETTRSVTVTADTLSGLTASHAVTITRPLADPRVVDLMILAPPRGGALHTVFANISNGGLTTATGLSARLVVDGALVAQEPLSPLSPGITRLISFSFVPRAEAQVVAVVLTSDLPAYDADLNNNAASLTYATPGMAPVTPSGPFSSDQALPAAAASFSIIALIGVALTEVGKSTFLSILFLPLYVKLKPREVLDQYLRGQIHGYIIANPGEHYNAIKEQLGVTNGALAYHLRVLEKADYIRAARDGMYKRFYPVGVKIPKRRRLSTFQESIVKTVRDRPALSQKELGELLGVSNQVINYHIKQLEGANIIRLERDGRSSRIFLGPDAPPDEMPVGAAGSQA
jgi:DNA-binding MarR family transcriptional regulator